MKTFIKYIILPLLGIVYFGGCAGHMGSQAVTKAQEFPGMYEEKPRSLLIMPPMNESTAADAKDYYATTIEIPLAFHGFYVFPYEITSDVLKQQGIYDAELLYNMPLNKFYDYFGADAVLFTRIKKWDVSYVVLASSLTVSIDAEIKSTRSSRVLWKYNGTVVVDLSGGNNSGGSLAGLIANAIATAINTAAADYTTYAKQANGRFIGSMPYGYYHPGYLKDQGMQIVDQTPGQE